MTRRNELLSQLVVNPQSVITQNEILCDLIDIAVNGIQTQGNGTLVMNLINDSSTFFSETSIQDDINENEDNDDDDIERLENLLETIHNTDFNTQVCITVITEEGLTNLIMNR